MEAIEAIRTRRSIGKLTGDVSDAELQTLVEAALCAPNHRLTAPWRFTALRDEARARLGTLWAEIVTAATAPSADADAADIYRKEARKPMRAPVLLVVSTRTVADPVVAAEDFAATAAATQNVLLAAHALGLAAIWRTGPMAYSTAVNAFLQLEATDRIVAIVYLGRAAMEPPLARPLDAGSVLHTLR